jgi:Kef-type K+ transport system membrane component KefB
MTLPFLFAQATDPCLDALRHISVEEVLLPILFQLGIIILVARLFAVLFRKIGQPSVVGEIAAGLVLGPSVLGHLPSISDPIFHPQLAGLSAELSGALLGWIFTTLSQIGLVFLLFLIGLEFDFRHLRWHGKSALAISVSGVALPFALGVGLATVMWSYVGDDRSPLGFALFMGTAMAITAIPILGRMMMELGIARTRLGAITISAAAFDDATGWILLATVAAIVRAEFSPSRSLLMAAETMGFALLMIFVVKPVLLHWARRVLRRNHGELGLNSLAILLAVMFACAIATNLIGIFPSSGPSSSGQSSPASKNFGKQLLAGSATW